MSCTQAFVYKTSNRAQIQKLFFVAVLLLLFFFLPVFRTLNFKPLKNDRNISFKQMVVIGVQLKINYTAVIFVKCKLHA